MREDSCIIGTRSRGLELAAPVSLPRDTRQYHAFLLGRTGAGKSTLMQALMFSDLMGGHDFALLDPLGGLADAIADAVHPARTNDVVYWNPGGDLENCIGFNPLHAVPPDDRHLVADNIVGTFMHIWAGVGLDESPRLVHLLYHALRLLLEAETETLLGLPRLLASDEFRARLLEKCRDRAIADFWTEEFPTDRRTREEWLGSVRNKVGMLLAPDPLRRILGQRTSTLDIARLMNRRGTLICNLAKGRLGATGAKLVGGLIASTIGHVAQRRVDIAPELRRPFSVYLDEIGNFASTGFAQAISESRQLAVSYVMAAQFLGQLPEVVADAIFANCGTVCAFRCGITDARDTLAAELGIDNARVLVDTPNYAMWMRTLEAGTPTEPFLVETLLPAPPARGRRAAVERHTIARHCRPRSVVEAMIERQL